jgi:hypothetical protein
MKLHTLFAAVLFATVGSVLAQNATSQDGVKIGGNSF